jgi:type III restriction enzyme
MVNVKSLGTGNTPLLLAEIITKKVNKEWDEGGFIEKVSPVTQDLLRFWDPKGSFSDVRKYNFHEGQWQAIINSIYVHEILKIKGVHDMYMSINPELLQEMDLINLKKDKYSHPKYCIKMATGTGKTWVMHALLIWQYLNAKNEIEKSGRYSKNFLIIAPGIIVYERLLDAFLGKRDKDGNRNFELSDFKQFEDLFLPPSFKEEIIGFIQNNVAQKEDIGSKVTGEGLIGITNWHLLMNEEEEIDNYENPLESPDKTLKKLLPITPGTGAGHSLEELDKKYFSGSELNYLSKLKDLVTFNDEAHHLGEWKTEFETLEKKWQIALSKISDSKKEKFIQIDFSATPYTITGSKLKRTKHFFPHIILDFELTRAIKLGLVKTVAIDKRKEFAAQPLDFTAERDGNEVVSLSEGQRVMLRAGIKKIKILEEEFTKLDSSKYPKMLVMCEDTKVVQHVSNFLKSENIDEDDIIEIHSNKKGEIGEKEWDTLRQKVFNIDKQVKPKIIISVLMLKEGFDVNNVCVIVPLRAASSAILLEQTIGRGLRLMWREPEYEDLKQETRERLLVKKEEPGNYVDILSIIEQPNFIEFYEKELGDALVETHEVPKKGKIIGDIILVELKENFKEYDLFWPLIISDKEEELAPTELTINELEPFPVSLEDLKPLVKKEGNIFKSEEMTVKTKFGEYTVTEDIFTATNYNTFIEKIINAVTSIQVRIKKKFTVFPVMQINTRLIAKLTDEYIRKKLFGENFDPLKDNNWKILLLTETKIIQHIVRNVAKTIYNLQNNIKINEAVIEKRYFSELAEMKMRETYTIKVAKTIYPKIAYPSNKGGFEKNFIEFIDADSKVKSFIKINEHYHDFSTVIYIREDGLLAHYHPDFMVKIDDKIFIVETKAERDLSSKNVQSKRLATMEWVEKVNEMNPHDRMSCFWNYVLLGENTFYGMSKKGADTEEILEFAKLNKSKIKGNMNQFLGIKEEY